VQDPWYTWVGGQTVLLQHKSFHNLFHITDAEKLYNKTKGPMQISVELMTKCFFILLPGSGEELQVWIPFFNGIKTVICNCCAFHYCSGACVQPSWPSIAVLSTNTITSKLECTCQPCSTERFSILHVWMIMCNWSKMGRMQRLLSTHPDLVIYSWMISFYPWVKMWLPVWLVLEDIKSCVPVDQRWKMCQNICVTHMFPNLLIVSMLNSLAKDNLC
jgi:hypothetical protein